MSNEGKRGYSVLIVDDMPINLQILSDFLKSEYHIKIAVTGKKALELAMSANPPDLILLDIVMPEMDGFEICRRLKACQRTEEIPVIFITVLAGIEDKVKGFAVGGADYVTKPFQREEVLSRVRTHLKIQQQNRQLQQQALELKLAGELAEKANKAKSEFLAKMSHEIRTPMNAILGFSEILMNRIQVPDERKWLSNIRTSGKSLLSLIDDILDLSKIEAGKMNIKAGPADIRKLLYDIETVFMYKIQKKNIAFYSEVSEAVPRKLLLDELRIRQILINLVGNAVKFTHKGYVKVSAGTEQGAGCRGQEGAERSCDLQPATCNPSPATCNLSPATCNLPPATCNLFFEVADTGIGIAEDQLELIFEKFHQQEGQSAAQYGGTGLGLSISKKLAELMNGEIRVESKVGKGSRFRLELYDVCVVLESEPGEKASESDERVTEFEPATLLIADDVLSARELIKVYLEEYPFSFIEAEDGSQVLKILSNRRPDLILMDMRMPGMRGEEVTEMIKKNDILKQIPVIAVTASVMKDTEKKLKSLFDGYIRKPVGRTELLSEMKRFLPYKMKKGKGSVKAVSSDPEPLSPHLSETTARWSQLLQLMENELIPEWKGIGETLIFEEVEEFASQVKRQGSEFACEILSNWSERVLRHLQTLELEKLSSVFRIFPELVREIRAKAAR